ncbi:LacI family DNA-binding transcriptional regulator [Microbacterium sp. NPDC058021]|uniref:LacI family DNA-binding transcriptional regulator n=1 Tax=Microbacterium sp. NPDC058021 TaxID=3346306 RepID=UPI0036DA08B6
MSSRPRLVRRESAGVPCARREAAMDQGRTPTIEDVAAAAGVSRSTVSRVINDDERVSARVRTQVRRAISDLAYSPNPAAQALARGGRRGGAAGVA